MCEVLGVGHCKYEFSINLVELERSACRSPRPCSEHFIKRDIGDSLLPRLNTERKVFATRGILSL